MIRKPFCRSLAFCACFPLLFSAVAQAQFSCTTNNGEVTITGYTGSGGVAAIPRTLNGLPVGGIGYKAFSQNNGLTGINIPESVTNIEMPAFSLCPGLAAIAVDPRNPAYSSLGGVLFNKRRTTLIQFPGANSGGYTIPNGVTNIGNNAFAYCFNLTGVTIPDSVLNIEPAAFYQCFGLTRVAIGGSVTNIGNNAFFGCVSLTGVSLPDSVVCVSDYAFAGCESLRAISVGPSNSSYCSVEGVLFDKSRTRLVAYPGGKGESYVVPDGVASIGADAFANCASLACVTIPGSVTHIGVNAFFGCTRLTGIYFRGNAPKLDSSPFRDRNNATIYHLPDAAGWGKTFGGHPTALWKL